MGHLWVSGLGLVCMFVPLSAALRNTSRNRLEIVNLAVQTATRAFGLSRRRFPEGNCDDSSHVPLPAC